MLHKKKIAIVLPAYNEAGFITKTLHNVPAYVDLIVGVNDASTDSTLTEMKQFANEDKRLQVLSNKKNGGVGFTVKKGLQYCLDKVDYVVIAAGDNQCDLTKIEDFVFNCETEHFDVCRGNRFLNHQELHHMPTIRRIGNSVYSFITKFASGYYSLFDFQSSFSAIKTSKLKAMDFSQLRDDYLFDNSLWINLNIVNARIKEIPAPVIYEGEQSDINYLKFVQSSLSYLMLAFLSRIYQKYVFVLHPIGIFFLGGSVLFTFGMLFGAYVAFSSIGPNTASTATVMLSVIPVITGFQLLLQAFVLDIQNEPK